MKPINEQKLIFNISFGMLLVAFLLFKLGITQDNGNFDLLADFKGAKTYVTFGYIMLISLVPFLAIKRTFKEYLILILAGIGSFSLVWIFHPQEWALQFWGVPNFIISSSGIGLVSMIMVLTDKKQDEQSIQYRQRIINFYIFANALQFGIFPLLDLTILFNPTTYDSIAFLIDNTFGMSPSSAVAKLVQAQPLFASLLDVVYVWITVGFAAIYALQIRHKKMPPANMLLVWAVSTVSCLVAYNLCPISGPIYLFGDKFFPNAMPALSEIADTITVVVPSYRNGFPSMHFGACLMLLFTARYQQSRTLNNILYTLSVLTVLATLGKGEHYLIDLVVSFPFIVAIQSFCTQVNETGQRFRLQAICGGLGLWLVWVCLVRFGLALFQTIPGFIYLVSIVTIATSLWLYRRLFAFEVWGYTLPATMPKQAIELTIKKISIPALFFISGFTGLVYEVVFTKELAHTFGGMATATYTVLAVYMGGMALGSWLGGFMVTKTRRSGLILYATCELIIGVYCLLTPALFALIKHLYVILAQNISPDAGVLVALRVLCGGLVLLVPTVLMGVTLPVMVSELDRKGLSIGNAVSKLYGANTLGAACGALVCGYLILPVLGVTRTTALSALGSLAVAWMAIQLNKQTSTAMPTASGKVEGADATNASHNPTVAWACLVAIFLTGSITMIMEVNYMQLLAVVAGNSVYSFSLMLFSLLLGLAAGAEVARYALSKSISVGLNLSLLLLGLSCVLLVGVFQWNGLPSNFAAYGYYSYHLNFQNRELIRAVPCWIMMFPPAAIIGACYPIALELVSSSVDPLQRIRNLGNAIGINTLGNIVGTLVGGFILLPLLGTQKTILVAAVASLISGLLIAIVTKKLTNPVVLGFVFAAVGLFAIQPPSLNYDKLSSGSNVYFSYRNNGHVIDHAESLDGGLTSVMLYQDEHGATLKTLLTNGKFQGNDSLTGEMKAQLGFAITPLLQTDSRDRALVIGYGTGVSARTLKEAGFRELDIVDLSNDLVTLANTHFAKVNAHVTVQPGVHTYITDGRNFLLLQNKKYDLISMEISSIWFAGAASLYSQEFYELAANRLNDYGVLQQWVQLHHMLPKDLASILSSMRSVFPDVRLYVVGGQGIIVGTLKSANLPEQAAIARMEQEPALMNLLNASGMTPRDVQGSLVLTANDVNNLVKTFAGSDDFVISNDDNSFLEYSTPKGNALDATKSMNNVMNFLKQFSTPYHQSLETK